MPATWQRAQKCRISAAEPGRTGCGRTAQSPETKGFLWYGPAPLSGRLPAAAAFAAVVLAAVSAAAAAPQAGGDSAASVRARAHSALLDLYAVDSKLQRA